MCCTDSPWGKFVICDIGHISNWIYWFEISTPQNILFSTLIPLMQLTSHVQFLMPSCGCHNSCYISLLNPVIAPKSSVKYLSCSAVYPLESLIHLSLARLDRRLVCQQIQVSVCSKHFASHCTPQVPQGVQSVPDSPGCTHNWLSIHSYYSKVQDLNRHFLSHHTIVISRW